MKPAPFHFDGHGINDADGNRIGKANINRYDRRSRIEYSEVSRLFAAAPELLAALKFLVREARASGIIPQESCMVQALAAIAKAEGQP